MKSVRKPSPLTEVGFGQQNVKVSSRGRFGRGVVGGGRRRGTGGQPWREVMEFSSKEEFVTVMSQGHNSLSFSDHISSNMAAEFPEVGAGALPRPVIFILF